MDGHGPVPMALWIANLCERFHSTPLVMYREYRNAPDGFIEAVVDAGSFADLKRAWEAPDAKRADFDETPMLRLLIDIEGELAQEEDRRG